VRKKSQKDQEAALDPNLPNVWQARKKPDLQDDPDLPNELQARKNTKAKHLIEYM